MKRLTFKQFVEATDIFGFDAAKTHELADDNMLSKPIHQFDLELMMDFLSKKKVGNFKPKTPFMNEIRWGDQPGAVKLEVDTGYTFYVKKLGTDKQGLPRWVSKKMFQLNRTGHGGTEDIVAHEIHNHLSNVFEGPLDAPVATYDDLENLTLQIYNKAKKVMKDIFIPEGVKKISDHAYILKFGVRGHGVEAPSQQRIEQNQLLVSYDPACGTIRINNYNIQSPTGGPHSWRIQPNNLDIYAFPSQGRDEISELCAVHMKYF